MARRSASPSFSFSDSEMPVRFGRYLLLKRTGKDAIGEHFLTLWGADEGIDQLRDIRAIYPQVAEDKEFVAEFSEEARALSQLSSSNAVKVLEVGSESGIPFVAQEHVEGASLARLQELAGQAARPCHWELAAHVVAEVLRGLDYVHRKEDVRGLPLGMRHGDVRPQNVLVSFSGEVKLTNFSSSLYSLVHQATNAKFQTERGVFAPPEAGAAQEEATVAGDLWGTSVILLSLLAGPASLQGVSSADPEALAGVALKVENVPRGVSLVLDKALHPDPAERFQDAQTLRERLLEIIRDNALGHPPDDLAAWAAELGSADRIEEEKFVRKMLRQDVRMSLDDSTELGKLGPGIVLEERYHLLRLLGEGGMGQVFEAEHLGIEKRVAVKVLHERVLNDAVAVERFKREAKVMGRLRHPNIVEVSDYGETESGNYFLVMELLDGDTLAARIAEATPIPALELVRIMMSVCDGLQAAHDAGVVHRDLKPENIFLTDSGPKIVDFGIAKRADLEPEESSLTRTGNICGTVEYLSPEQLRGQEIDHRVDIYTAGLIIYESLTGETPFRGRNMAETMHRVMTDKVVPPRKRIADSSIPQGLEAICLKAMSRDGAKRYRSAAEMKAALEALYSQLEEDGEVSPRRSPYRLHRRAKVLMGTAALLIGAIVVVLGLFQWLDGNNGSSDFKAAFVAVEPPADARPGSRRLLSDAGQTMGGLVAASAPVETEDKETEDKETSVPDTGAVKKSGGQGETPVEVREETRETPETPTEEVEHGVDDLLVRGEAALARMEMDQAEFLFQRATEKDPTVPRAWFGRGKVAFEQGHSDKAIRMIQRALKLNPGKPKWRIFLGKVYMAAGYRERAIKEWQRVVRIYPHNREARRLLEEAGADVE